MILHTPQLLRIEARRRGVDALEGKSGDKLLAAEKLRLVVVGPAEERHRIVDRPGEIAHLSIKVDDHRIEGVGRCLDADPLGDPRAVIGHLTEVWVFQILRELALRELRAASRLSHERQMGIRGERVPQREGDVGLAWRVGEMLLGPDHVGDLEVVVVDDTRQVVEAGAVGPLDDVVLLALPGKLHPAADGIVDDKRPLPWHLQPHHSLPPLRHEAGGVVGGEGGKPPAVEVGLAGGLRGLPLLVEFLWSREVAVGMPRGEELLHGRLVAGRALRLEVRGMRPADPRPFVPIDPQPLEPREDRLERFLDIPLRVGVVDAEDERPAMPPRVQPVEQRRADAADVEITGRARSKAGADGHGERIPSPPLAEPTRLGPSRTGRQRKEAEG